MLKTTRNVTASQGKSEVISNSRPKPDPSKRNAVGTLVMTLFPPDPSSNRLPKKRQTNVLEKDSLTKVGTTPILDSKSAVNSHLKVGQGELVLRDSYTSSKSCNKSQMGFCDTKTVQKDLSGRLVEPDKQVQFRLLDTVANTETVICKPSILSNTRPILNVKESGLTVKGYPITKFTRQSNSKDTKSNIRIMPEKVQVNDRTTQSSLLTADSRKDEAFRSSLLELIGKKEAISESKSTQKKNKSPTNIKIVPNENEAHNAILPIKSKKLTKDVTLNALSTGKGIDSLSRNPKLKSSQLSSQLLPDHLSHHLKATVIKPEQDPKTSTSLNKSSDLILKGTGKSPIARVKDSSQQNPFSFKNFIQVDHKAIASNFMSVNPSTINKPNPLLPIFESTTSALKYRTEKRELTTNGTADYQSAKPKPQKSVTIFTPSEINQSLMPKKARRASISESYHQKQYTSQSNYASKRSASSHQSTDVIKPPKDMEKSAKRNLTSEINLSPSKIKLGTNKLFSFKMQSDDKPKKEIPLKIRFKTPLKKQLLKVNPISQSKFFAYNQEGLEKFEEPVPTKRRMIPINSNNWQNAIIFRSHEHSYESTKAHPPLADSKKLGEMKVSKNQNKKAALRHIVGSKARGLIQKQSNFNSAVSTKKYQSYASVYDSHKTRYRSSSPNDPINFYSNELALSKTMIEIKNSPKIVYDDSDIIGWILNRSSTIPFISRARHSTLIDSSIKFISYNSHAGIYRPNNEDRVSITISGANPSKISKAQDELHQKTPFLFSIFDGHGGEQCSQYLTDNLHKQILADIKFDSPNLQQDFQRLYTAIDKQFLKSCSRVRDQYSGSCALTVCLIDSTLFTINVGDSRCIMSANGGSDIIELTRDHKPGCPIELERILASGGKITRSVWNSVQRHFIEEIVTQKSQLIQFESNKVGNESHEYGPWRMVPGGLSVSRTFGDFEMKSLTSQTSNENIMCDPEVQQFDVSHTDFVIIGCRLIR